tara:strand:- start:2433 stop:2708 length:276 start_codon:yes stop_codon:yes gene_type:complete
MVGATKETLNLVINYMKYRNSHKFGYLKYYYFKRIIGFITGEKEGLKIRAIFQRLLDLEVVNKKRIIVSKGNTTLAYMFNPYENLIYEIEE